MILQIGVVFVSIIGPGLSSLFHDLAANDIDGQTVEFSQFEGKVVLVVNVASQCGFTDGHYRGLQRLYDILGHNGDSLEILAFPCNQFGQQEPGSPAEVAGLVRSEYGVSFRLMEKVEVMGKSAHPVWRHLTGSSNVTPSWNFFKYLLDHNGDIIQAWGPQTAVEDIFESVEAAVQGAELEAQVESPLAGNIDLHDEL